MSMAGVPPSSADFTPSWLKFNNNKPCESLVPKDNSYKRAVSHNYSTPSCATSEVTCENQFTTAKDKAWPQLAGLKVTGKLHEQPQWPSTSKVLHKLTYTTTSSCKNFSSIVNESAKHSSMESDFPCLGKSQQRTKVMKQPQNVWNKPLVLKSTDNVRNNSLHKATTNRPMCDGSSIYKSLVPKTTSANNKQPYRRTVSVPSGGSRYKSDANNVATKHQLSSTISGFQDVNEKDLLKHDIPHTLSTMDDFPSTPGVKRHKKGKNVFLKELRQTDQPTRGSFENQNFSKSCEQQERCNINEENLDSKTKETSVHELIIVGVEPLEDEKRDEEMCETTSDDAAKDWWEEVDESIPQDDSAPSNPPLSSSLEAEHRLLRQMGWTDCDEGADGDAAGSDESPLTDAEIREFFLNYKKKGLLSVPSPVHREIAFRDALSAWLLSGPPVMRHPDKGGKIQPMSPFSTASSSDYSNVSSCGMDSE